MHLRIHVDGGSRGNPGPAAAGVVIHDLAAAADILAAGYFLGQTTNNVAEYSGLLRGLEIALKLGGENLEIFSDSELMVRQLQGEYRVKSPDLQPLYRKALALLSKFQCWRITHVRREFNQRADELANQSLDARRDVIVESLIGFLPATTPLPLADTPAAAPARRSAKSSSGTRTVRCPHCHKTFPLDPADL